MITVQYNNWEKLGIDEATIDKDKFISIRTTELESFLACWYKAFNNNEKFTKYSIFHIWKQLHKYMQAMMLWKEKAGDKILNEVMTVKESSFIRKCWQALKKYDEDNWTEYSKIDMNEMSYWLYIEFPASEIIPWNGDKYLIYIEWTIDGVRYNEDGTVSIIDLKSASSMWNDEDMEAKFQKIMYPWLYRKYNENDNIRDFTYLVFDKKVTPSFKPFEYKPVFEEVEELVFEAIKKYMKAYITKQYFTKRSWKCNWCSLKKDWTCPEFMDI